MGPLCNLHAILSGGEVENGNLFLIKVYALACSGGVIFKNNSTAPPFQFLTSIKNYTKVSHLSICYDFDFPLKPLPAEFMSSGFFERRIKLRLWAVLTA